MKVDGTMKLAITADLHLTTVEKNPERYHALEDILAQMVRLNIRDLLVAGDLFDATGQNYADFDALCSRPEFNELRIIVIPGNHDARITQALFSARNVEVISTPLVKEFGPARVPFLLVPYMRDRTMGEVIAPFHKTLAGKDWILVGHGDWAGGLQEPNPLEPGVYMPLTRVDVEHYKPVRVFLGHIHKRSSSKPVYYPGSPVAVDISETGRRYFLVFDLQNFSVSEQVVKTDVLYFKEHLVVLPVENESDYLKKEIAGRMAAWGLSDDEMKKVRLQVQLSGFTANKNALQKTVETCFSTVQFYQQQPPDLSRVAVSDDRNRSEIARRVAQRLQELNWDLEPYPPEKEEILLQALKTIYE